MYPFERFSESAKGSLTRAQREAENGGQSYIGTEHLLLGLAGQEDGLAAMALSNFGLELLTVRAIIRQALVQDRPSALSQIIPTSRVKRIIEMAFELARSENSSFVDTGHLLVAIADEGHGIAAQVLVDRGIPPSRVRDEISAMRKAGQADHFRGTGESPPSRYQHLDIQDAEGKTIAIEIIFPREYSEARCSKVVAQVKAAVALGGE